jgi:hypothetical protein
MIPIYYKPNGLSDGKFLPSNHYMKGDSEPDTCISTIPVQTAAATSASLDHSFAERTTASIFPGPLSVGYSYKNISFCQILPNPQKLSRKHRKKQGSRLLNLDSSSDQPSAKIQLKTEKI